MAQTILKSAKAFIIATLIIFGIGILPGLAEGAPSMTARELSLGNRELREPRILPSTTTHYLPNGASMTRTVEDSTPPLKKAVSNLSPLNEIYPIGVGTTKSIIDDGLHTYKVSDLFGGEPIKGTLFDPAVGDFNGDGDEEVCFLQGQLPQDDIWSMTAVLFVDPTPKPGDQAAFPFHPVTGYGNLFWFNIEAGDFDGDSIDELLLVQTLNPKNYDDYTNSFIKVYLWDFDGKLSPFRIPNIEQVAEKTFADEKFDHIQTFVAVGDFDGDFIDEFAITTDMIKIRTEGHMVKHAKNEFWTRSAFELTRLDTHQGWICEYAKPQNQINILHAWNSTELGIGPDGNSAGYQAPISAGDFDGDGADELACFSLFELLMFNGNTFRWDRYMKQSLYLIQDAGQLYRPVILEEDPAADSEPPLLKVEQLYRDLGMMPGVDAGDIDGDGRDEILCYLIDIQNTSERVTSYIDVWNYNPQKDRYLGDSMPPTEFITAFDSRHGGYVFHPVIADVDFDQRAEVIRCSLLPVLHETSLKWPTFIMSWKADKTWQEESALVPYQVYHHAIGDFDGDGVTLQYTGEHWKSSAPPGIVAALAAPPTYGDPQIAQNREASTSGFSSSTEKSVTNGEAFGAAVGATLSFSVEVEFIFSYEAGITLSKEMTLSHSTMYMETQTRSFSSGYDMNTVIFHLTDYHSYKYTILAFPGNAAMVGQNLTIDLPTGTQLTQWNIVEYNRHYASSPPIGAETFTHTIGEPWTYPNQTTMNTLAPTRWQMANNFLVDNTNSWSGGALSIAHAETQGGSTVRGVEMYVGVAVAGVGFQGSVGFTEEQAYSVSVGNETAFSCQIGGIPDYGLHQQYAFTFAPVVYFVEHPAGITYPVLNYVVEGANSLPLEGELIPATSFIPETTSPTATPPETAETPETTTDSTPSGPIPGFEALPVFLAIIFVLWWRKRPKHT